MIMLSICIWLFLSENSINVKHSWDWSKNKKVLILFIIIEPLNPTILSILHRVYSKNIKQIANILLQEGKLGKSMMKHQISILKSKQSILWYWTGKKLNKVEISKEWKISKPRQLSKLFFEVFGLCVKKGTAKKLFAKRIWFSILTIN